MQDIENAIRHLKAGNFTEAQLDMAIKALEREVPKIQEKDTDIGHDWYCGVCGAYIAPMKDNRVKYCFICGQKLDWK